MVVCLEWLTLQEGETNQSQPVLKDWAWKVKNVAVRKITLHFRNQDGAQKNWPPMIGSILDGSPVIKIPESLMNETYAPRGMYECPSYFHNGTGLYPFYMQGSGYLIPWWSIECLYQQSFELPYFFIEDVFVAGWAGIFQYFWSKKHVSTIGHYLSDRYYDLLPNAGLPIPVCPT